MNLKEYYYKKKFIQGAIMNFNKTIFIGNISENQIGTHKNLSTFSKDTSIDGKNNEKNP